MEYSANSFKARLFGFGCTKMSDFTTLEMETGQLWKLILIIACV